MPRGARLRVDHSSSIMHLMNRISGQPGELPFDDVEKEKFFKLAERLSVFYTIEIISLVVMGNHWHAIVRTFPELPTKEDAARRFAALYGEKRAQPDWRRDEIYVPIAERMRDVSCFVKDLQGQFTAWFNKTRPKKRRGSLWAGRFKSILLDDETAVLRCMKYVEMNPVRAGIVADPSDYRFSTFGRLCLAGKTFFKGNMINTLRHKMNFPEEYSDQQILHEFGACRTREADYPDVRRVHGVLHDGHGHALHQSEQGRMQLEERVREATAEIEHNFRQLAELRVEQVTERERKRIAADLHDDLGAKLLTIVHTSDNDRISSLAREALEEMRLSVRGLTGRPVRLADALGDWRAEIVSRLAQAGIEGGWDAPEDLPQTLSARAYVQTTRILREATSNIIKHSKASFCSVAASINAGDFQLVVQDNGDGIAAEIDRRLDRGHGLASMKSRAKQLQGQCLVESGPGYGTVIRLTVPLDRAMEGS